MAGWIHAIDRIIIAVGEHIVAEDTLTSGDKGIGVEEAADLGIIITGLQVIEPGILDGGLAKAPFLHLVGMAGCYPH